MSLVFFHYDVVTHNIYWLKKLRSKLFVNQRTIGHGFHLCWRSFVSANNCMDRLTQHLAFQRAQSFCDGIENGLQVLSAVFWTNVCRATLLSTNFSMNWALTHYQNFSVQNCFVRIEQTLWLYFHFVALLQTPPRTFPDSGTNTVALDFEVLGHWTTTQQCTFAIIYSEWWHVATDSSVALGIYISAPSSVSTIKQGAGALCQSEVTNFGFVCLQLSSIFGELNGTWVEPIMPLS